MAKTFLLAPMAELSHRALRELIAAFGFCDEYYTEMISAPALIAGGEFEPYYTDNMPNPEKLVYQLTGPDAESMAGAAAILDRLECRGIDLNMGCPAPVITRKGGGVKWMDDRERAARMTEKVRASTKKRLSVKLRLGRDGDFEYLLRFCRTLEDAGVEFIVLHGRKTGEKLKRSARWNYVEDLSRELSIPVAGNGDIAGAAGLAERAAGPWSGVMVGRSAVREPWIFAEAAQMPRKKAPAAEGADDAGRQGLPQINIEETGLRFLELLALHQPPVFHISRARRFFSYFCDNLFWANHVKNLINSQKDLKGIENVWRAYFCEHPADAKLRGQ